MDERRVRIATLRKQLSAATRDFLRGDSEWQRPIRDVLNVLFATGTRGVLFGGVPRSLLLAKIFGRSVGRPRDLDIVISEGDPNTLGKQLLGASTKRTRFGGVKLHYRSWNFDIWPLESTWMFKETEIEPTVENLPLTTFFNLEAIAVGIDTSASGPQVFSGNEQFFDGILNRELEINNELNPFPELCVVRSIVMAAKLEFTLGPKLTAYLNTYGKEMSPDTFDRIQLSHYNTIYIHGWRMKQIVERLVDTPCCHCQKWSISTPRQLTLFDYYR